MIIGVPKETKGHEYRVALLPVGAELLTRDGHKVLVQKTAGLGSGFADEAYAAAGAELVETAAELFARSEMIIKVKEPQKQEIALLRADQILFCYFHFAADRALTEGCLKSGIAAVAYETLEDSLGRLPLLTPMSEVAGKMSIQEGAKYLEKPTMGRGILLGGVPGVEPANVVVLGGGVVGENAAKVAAGLGSNVIVMDINIDRLRHLENIMPANVDTIFSDPHAITHYVLQADLVIGAVLIPGSRAPHLVTEEHVRRMKSGAVIVDVSIDQGGCVATARPTTHEHPTYIIHDVVHFCVTNIPGAVSRTSAQALCNATLPYARQLASRGVDGFAALSPGHALGVNLRRGKITNQAVARDFPDMASA